LILLSGNAAKILKANGWDANDFDVKKADEKDLSRFGFMLRLIKSGNYSRVVFGTQDLEFQRFSYFIMMLLFMAGKWQGGIADEQGKFTKFSLMKFVLICTPRFIAELIASLFIVIFFYIKYPIKLWLMKRK
jgi:hypothetical protein